MNENNLIRPEDLTPSERREIAQKGGKASGEARRRKKDMKQMDFGIQYLTRLRLTRKNIL